MRTRAWTHIHAYTHTRMHVYTYTNTISCTYVISCAYTHAMSEALFRLCSHRNDWPHEKCLGEIGVWRAHQNQQARGEASLVQFVIVVVKQRR